MENVSRILETRELQDKHTGENIWNAAKAILEEFGAWCSNNIYTTDNAANMKLAMRQQTWLGCAGHNLNLVLSHTLRDQTPNPDDDPGQEDFMTDIFQLISVCKTIIAHVKRSRIQEVQLDTTVATRWNSILTVGACQCR